jgi:hypothetical protein
VDGFTDSAGVQHKPGEIVDLPASYDGETWLERVEPTLKPVVPAAKVEAPTELVAVPLGSSKEPKKSRKAK